MIALAFVFLQTSTSETHTHRHEHFDIFCYWNSKPISGCEGILGKFVFNEIQQDNPSADSLPLGIVVKICCVYRLHLLVVGGWVSVCVRAYVCVVVARRPNHHL